MRYAVVMNDGRVHRLRSLSLPYPQAGQDYVWFGGDGSSTIMRWSGIQMIMELPDDTEAAEEIVEHLELVWRP